METPLLAGAPPSPRRRASSFIITPCRRLAQDPAHRHSWDPDEGIWISTLGSPSQYSGCTFTPSPSLDGCRPRSPPSRGDRRGRLWVGTPAGAAVLAGSRFTPPSGRSRRRRRCGTSPKRPTAPCISPSARSPWNSAATRSCSPRPSGLADDFLLGLAVATTALHRRPGGLEPVREAAGAAAPGQRPEGRTGVRSLFHARRPAIFCSAGRPPDLAPGADGRHREIRQAPTPRHSTWMRPSTARDRLGSDVRRRLLPVPEGAFRRLDVVDGLSTAGCTR